MIKLCSKFCGFLLIKICIIIVAYAQDGEFCIAKATSCSPLDDQNFNANKEPVILQSISENYLRRRNNRIDDDCFRAAVVQFNRLDLKNCRSSASVNLQTLESATRVASNNGAKMIVFPEDGLFIGNDSYINDCLEEIPDPEDLDSINNNPCIQSSSFESNPILKHLSCIARSNKIYVIANYGTKQKCTQDESRNCSGNGYLSLNTDVVFDPNGTFIKRYRKYNIFVEVFARAPTLETVYFDTPQHGRFGLFTCFDILFKKPAISLVEDYHIDTLIFPTWWYDELPILSALQFQDGWSWSNGVNFLSSNILRPTLGSTGSGIFSANYSIHVGANSNKSHILIANLSSRKGTQCSQGFDPIMLDLNDKPINQVYEHKNFELYPQDGISKFGAISDEQTICSGRVCCSFVYKLAEGTPREFLNRLILIARDRRRTAIFKWQEQACALATVEELDTNFYGENASKSPTYSTEALVAFDYLALHGTFTTKYVFPYAAHNVSYLVDRDKRQFNCDRFEDKYKCRHQLVNLSYERSSTLLYSFGMYARPYDEDL